MGEDKNTQGEPLISRDAVWDILQFSDALYNNRSWLYGGGVYTPEILNQNLENLNNDIEIPTHKKVVKALSNAVDNEDVLRSFSQYMEYFDTI